MMHMNNPSTLLGGKKRSVYYPPTGTGRDTYIMADNGGTNINYRCQGVPQLGNYMKFGPASKGYRPASYTRFQKYASDGSGRDKYVVSQHGGQYNEEDENSVKLIKFRNTMRDGGWKKDLHPRTYTNGWKTKHDQDRAKEMISTQSINTRRLSEPKKTNNKYEETLNEYRRTFQASKYQIQ